MTDNDLFDKYLRRREPAQQQRTERRQVLEQCHDQRLINAANFGIQEVARAAAARLRQAGVPFTPVTITLVTPRRRWGKRVGTDTYNFPPSHPRVIAASKLFPHWRIHLRGIGEVCITEDGRAVHCDGHWCPPKGPLRTPTTQPLVVDYAVDPRHAHYVAEHEGRDLDFAWTLTASDLAGRAYHMRGTPTYFDELIAEATVKLLPWS